MIEPSGKVNKPKTYNGFNRNILFFIQGRISSDENFFELFYILATEEIDEIMVKM